jgi:hypothetical protein
LAQLSLGPEANYSGEHGFLQCAILDDPGAGELIVSVVRRDRSDPVDLLALIGTLHLWAWPSVADLLPLLDVKSAWAHFRRAVTSKGTAIIRLAAGLADLQPGGLPLDDREAMILAPTLLNPSKFSILLRYVVLIIDHLQSPRWSRT